MKTEIESERIESRPWTLSSWISGQFMTLLTFARIGMWYFAFMLPLVVPFLFVVMVLGEGDVATLRNTTLFFSPFAVAWLVWIVFRFVFPAFREVLAVVGVFGGHFHQMTLAQSNEIIGRHRDVALADLKSLWRVFRRDQ